MFPKRCITLNLQSSAFACLKNCSAFQPKANRRWSASHSCCCCCYFFSPELHLIEVTESLIICQCVLSVTQRCHTRAERLCLNSSNRARFPAQGHAYFRFVLYTAAALLFVFRHKNLLQDYCATANESYSSFSCLVRMGICLFWPFKPLERTHPENRSMLPLSTVSPPPEKPTRCTGRVTLGG